MNTFDPSGEFAEYVEHTAQRALKFPSTEKLLLGVVWTIDLSCHQNICMYPQTLYHVMFFKRQIWPNGGYLFSLGRIVRKGFSLVSMPSCCQSTESDISTGYKAYSQERSALKCISCCRMG
jgi:hypothetical protein